MESGATAGSSDITVTCLIVLVESHCRLVFITTANEIYSLGKLGIGCTPILQSLDRLSLFTVRGTVK